MQPSRRGVEGLLRRHLARGGLLLPGGGVPGGQRRPEVPAGRYEGSDQGEEEDVKEGQERALQGDQGDRREGWPGETN